MTSSHDTSLHRYDLIVIGGGPAGTAAAITAARAGARVLLFERGRYPRHKVCGEFVSAESLNLLLQLLPEHDLLAGAPPIHQSSLFAAGTRIDVEITPPAVSITRFALDAALWRAAESSGVTALQQTTVLSINRQGPHFVASTSTGAFTASAVIIAAGRWSNLEPNRPQEMKLHPEKYLGVKAHFCDPVRSLPEGTVELHFFPGGYCGVQSVADRIVSVCAMVQTAAATTLPQVFEHCSALSPRLREWQPCFEPVTTYPLMFRTPRPAHDGILYAGDAAGFVDPFVGDGISLALNSGVAAALALAPLWQRHADLSDCCRSYCAEYDRRFLRVFRNAARIRQLLALPPAFQRAAAQLMRVPGVSRQFVRLTRAA